MDRANKSELHMPIVELMRQRPCIPTVTDRVKERPPQRLWPERTLIADDRILHCIKVLGIGLSWFVLSDNDGTISIGNTCLAVEIWLDRRSFSTVTSIT